MKKQNLENPCGITLSWGQLYKGINKGFERTIKEYMYNFEKPKIE